MRCHLWHWLLLAALCTGSSAAKNRIGNIEFFGHKGIDVAKILTALPIHKGDEFRQQTEHDLRRAITNYLGNAPTDIATICCDENQDFHIFIGLPGATNKRFPYNSEPKETTRLSPDIINIDKQLNKAIQKAVRKGGQSAEEDHSKGYSLIKDPAARSLQLTLRQVAIQHEQELIQVLKLSSSAEQRRVASSAIGYLNQSREQIGALVDAARDVDPTVRNNATRALYVLINSNASFIAEVSPDTFIQMINSGTWTDRNKGVIILMGLTAGRGHALLANIRLKAFDSLAEMASWRHLGYALPSRVILGRVAGISENRIEELSRNGPDAIIEAAKQR